MSQDSQIARPNPYQSTSASPEVSEVDSYSRSNLLAYMNVLACMGAALTQIAIVFLAGAVSSDCRIILGVLSVLCILIGSTSGILIAGVQSVVGLVLIGLGVSRGRIHLIAGLGAMVIFALWYLCNWLLQQSGLDTILIHV